MMKKSSQFLLSALLLASTFVQAATEYEEVSYEDLVNRLNQRKTSVIQNANDPLDQIKLHAGFGLISSANNIKADNSRNDIRYQNGFQLSLGIDLFSPDWVAETALRNFGQVQSGTESRSLREFDLKFMNRGAFSSGSYYRLGTGIGNRYLRLEDAARGISISENTPTALFFGGIDAFVQKNLSLGVEAGLRTSMTTETVDKNSFDLTLRLDTYF